MTVEEIRKMIQEKLNIKIVDKVSDSATSVNLFEEVEVSQSHRSRG